MLWMIWRLVWSLAPGVLVQKLTPWKRQGLTKEACWMPAPRILAAGVQPCRAPSNPGCAWKCSWYRRSLRMGTQRRFAALACHRLQWKARQSLCASKEKEMIMMRGAQWRWKHMWLTCESFWRKRVACCMRHGTQEPCIVIHGGKCCDGSSCLALHWQKWSPLREGSEGSPIGQGPCLTPRTLVLRLDSETLMLDSEAHHAEEEMSRCQEDEHQTNLTFLTPVPVRATNYCMSMSISSQSRQVPQPWKCLFVLKHFTDGYFMLLL